MNESWVDRCLHEKEWGFAPFSLPPFAGAASALRCAGHVVVVIVDLDVDGNVTYAFDKGEVVTWA